MEQLKLLSLEPWWVQAMGLFEDGSVRKAYLVPTTQRYCYTYKIGEDLGWRNVKSLSSSRSHLVGLTRNGQVYIKAGSSYHFRGVETWTKVTLARAGYEITAGLCEDGTLRYIYNGDTDFFEVKGKNIIDITLYDRTGYGIDEEGTLFRFEDGEIQILTRTSGHVVQLGVINNIIYGLTQEGIFKVLYGADNDRILWRNVIRMVSGNYHLLGLTDQGEVLWLGNNSEQAEALNPDRNIINIFAGCYHSIAMDDTGCLFSPVNYWN